MTEFYTHCGTERYFDFDDKVCDEETGKALTVKEIVTVLNELNNQADAVRTELQLCEEENTELQKENEQLKSFIKGTCIFCGANLRQQYIEKYNGDIE